MIGEDLAIIISSLIEMSGLFETSPTQTLILGLGLSDDNKNSDRVSAEYPEGLQLPKSACTEVCENSE